MRMLDRIPVSRQRFAAVPCDTTPTLQVQKSANKRKSRCYSGRAGGPHNLKVTGSNPVPATKLSLVIKLLCAALRGGVCVCSIRGSTVEARGRENLSADARPETTHSAQSIRSVIYVRSSKRSLRNGAACDGSRPKLPPGRQGVSRIGLSTYGAGVRPRKVQTTYTPCSKLQSATLRKAIKWYKQHNHPILISLYLSAIFGSGHKPLGELANEISNWPLASLNISPISPSSTRSNQWS